MVVVLVSGEAELGDVLLPLLTSTSWMISVDSGGILSYSYLIFLASSSLPMNKNSRKVELALSLSPTLLSAVFFAIEVKTFAGPISTTRSTFLLPSKSSFCVSILCSERTYKQVDPHGDYSGHVLIVTAYHCTGNAN